MKNPIPPLAFLWLFNLIGGIAFGWALRRLVRRQFSCNTIFFIVWGGLFGGLPFMFGIAEYLKGDTLLLPVQVALFVLPILVVPFVPDEFFETIHSPNIASMAIGGTFLLIGFGVLVTNLFQVDAWPEKIIISGIFILIGGGVFLLGLIRILKS